MKSGQHFEEDGMTPTIAELRKAQTFDSGDGYVAPGSTPRPAGLTDGQRRRLHRFMNPGADHPAPHSLLQESDNSTYLKVANILAFVHETLAAVGSDGPEFNRESFEGLYGLLWACEDAIRTQLRLVERYNESVRNESDVEGNGHE